jgi:hypothetical protein
MRVRFIKPLRVYRRGDVVDLGDGEANVLIAREIVKPVTESTMFETAAVEHETRTAAVKRTRKQRVRECDTEA